MNKTVKIGSERFKMYSAPTGWIFVRSKKTGRTYSIAKIVDNEIIEIDSEPALSAVTNKELAEAWISQL